MFDPDSKKITTRQVIGLVLVAAGFVFAFLLIFLQEADFVGEGGTRTFVTLFVIFVSTGFFLLISGSTAFSKYDRAIAALMFPTVFMFIVLNDFADLTLGETLCVMVDQAARAVLFDYLELLGGPSPIVEDLGFLERVMLGIYRMVMSIVVGALLVQLLRRSSLTRWIISLYD